MTRREDEAVFGALLLAIAAAAVWAGRALWPVSPLLPQTAPPDLSTLEGNRRRWSPSTKLIVVIALGVAAGLVTAAGYEVRGRLKQREAAIRVTGGDPERGKRLLVPYGCAGCHTIPGVAEAKGLVGPPLGGIAKRVYVGGVVTNTPDNLVSWITDPRAHSDKTAMPKTGISAAQARDVAAYLYTLD
jgi:cytochrome c2